MRIFAPKSTIAAGFIPDRKARTSNDRHALRSFPSLSGATYGSPHEPIYCVGSSRPNTSMAGLSGLGRPRMMGLSPGLIVCGAVLAGTILGGLTCAGAVYFVQWRQLQAKRIFRDLDRREDVYSRFIEQASEVWLDSFETPNDPGNLICLSALVGRIRLASTQPVLEAAVGVMDCLLDTSQRLPANARDFIGQAPREFMAPLTAFTAACRVERERMLRGL
jgi:hypothetical protein